MNIWLKDFLVKTVFRIASVVNSIIPKNPNKILLYENNVGFQDNTRAIYDYMIRNKYNQKYTIIVSVNKDKPRVVPFNVKTTSNIGGVLSFFSAGHVFYCHGKIPMYPAKKQKVVQMWHGTPFKGNNTRQKKSITPKPYYTSFLAASPFFVHIIAENFFVKEEDVAICDQPRTDMMFDENELPKELKKFKKIIIWMPTYRNSKILGDEEFEMKSIVPIFSLGEFEELEKELSKYNICLIIKLHSMQDLDLLKAVNYDHIWLMSDRAFLEKGWVLYRLLSKTDALITDYSSVFHDYILLDKPIGYAIDDYDEFDSKRGFLVDNPDFFMAGEKIHTKDEFYRFIYLVANNIDNYKAQREEVKKITHKYVDGMNCKRALEIGGVIND